MLDGRTGQDRQTIPTFGRLNKFLRVFGVHRRNEPRANVKTFSAKEAIDVIGQVDGFFKHCICEVRKIINLTRILINQSINQSIILFSNAGYRKAAIRLMWTYNDLIKCETKIIYKITLRYLNIQYKSLK